MSETTETEVGKGAGDPVPGPVVESTPATEQPEAATPEADEAEAETKRENRRVAQLRARLGAAEREKERQAVELEFYRRQAQQQPQAEETPEQRYARERAGMRAELETELRTERFHQQGTTDFDDWRQRCADLMSMGADAGFAQLLVEMPDGVKVTAALAGDPEEVQRIANLRSERARAVALGKYAATLEDAPRTRTTPRAPQVTQAPAPVRPVTGRASPSLNEYAADANTLVDKYMRENIDRQRRR